MAIAFGREGADVLIAYLNEDIDANESARLVEEAGQKTVLVRPGVRRTVASGPRLLSRGHLFE